MKTTNVTFKADFVVCRLLTPAAVQKLRNVFSEIDKDASGSVSLAEFQEACGGLSLAVTRDELNAFFANPFYWSTTS